MVFDAAVIKDPMKMFLLKGAVAVYLNDEVSGMRRLMFPLVDLKL
jgi:hypothetical protein